MPKFSPTGTYVISSDDLGANMGPDWWWIDAQTATGYLYAPRVAIPGRYLLRYPEKTLEFVGDGDQAVRRGFYAAAGRWLLDRSVGGPVDWQGRTWPENERAACGMGDQGEELFVTKPTFASFVIRRTDGSEQMVPATGQINAEVVMRGGRFLWHSPDGLRESNGTLVGPNGAMQVFRGDYGVGYVAGWGLAVWRLGTTLGWPLWNGDAFFPDLWLDSSASLTVVASKTRGDTERLWFGLDLTTEPVDLRVPPVVVQPSFAFSHPVLVAPFKDPDGRTDAPLEVLVNQTGQTANRPYIAAEDSLAGPVVGPCWGIYTESLDIGIARQLALMNDTRIVYCHDAPTPPVIPGGLRPCDEVWIEYYLLVTETLEQSIARWRVNTQTLLDLWLGDCGVVPMFYCQGGIGDEELWPVSAVLDGLGPLSELVNLSPRLKVIAPFAYQRANGIVAHPELQEAFARLLDAAYLAGRAVLLPVSPEPPAPPMPPVVVSSLLFPF